MTPPVRPDWTDPDAYELRDALVLAETDARLTGQEHVVAGYVVGSALVFNVMLAASFEELRRTQHDRLARLVRVLPDGSRYLEPNLRLLWPPG